MSRVPFGVVGSLLFLSLADPALGQGLDRAAVGVIFGNSYTDADRVTGSQSAVGVVASLRVLPRLSVEAEYLHPSSLISTQYEGTSISFAGPFPPGTPREEIDQTFVFTRVTNERRTSSIISVGVLFHPAKPIGRWTPRFFVGVANHHVEEREALQHLRLPPGVTLEQVNRSMAPESRWSRNLGGLTVGGSVAVALTDHLVVAPDLRYDYGSIGDEINNWLRGSVRIAW